MPSRLIPTPANLQSGKLVPMTARTLVLLRHAKAERSATRPDIDRRLTDRGHADAAAAGAWLATHGYVPDLVICSPTKRTRQTWHGIAVALGKAAPGKVALADVSPPRVSYEPMAYVGGAADLLALAQGAGAVGIVLLVGHNPSVSQLSMLLDPNGGRDGDGLRTCGIAVHEVPGSWADLAPAQAPRVAWHTARA